MKERHKIVVSGGMTLTTRKSTISLAENQSELTAQRHFSGLSKDFLIPVSPLKHFLL